MGKETPKVPSISHLFQVQLVDTHLTRDQADQLASALRSAATRELLTMDFRIEELAPLFRGVVENPSCDGCGGGCKS